jgi:hypothetical protein
MREERSMASQRQQLNMSADTTTVTEDFKTTISLKSGAGDGMMRRCCRRGKDPTTMRILDNYNEAIFRRGSTKCTLSQIVVFKLNMFVFMCEKGP